MTTPNILDGNFLAKNKLDLIKNNIEIKLEYGRKAPKLVVILVGDNPASKIYVKNKEKKARECLIDSETIFLNENVSKSELEEVIFKLNLDVNVNGILLQLPLPKGFDEKYFLSLISPNKDVDCLTPFNQSKIFNDTADIYPCTPSGVLNLIDFAMVGGVKERVSDMTTCDLSGKNALVIGRSLLVGKPLALMLLRRNATVTLAHSKTKDLQKLVKDKDIIVSCAGKEKLLNSDNIKDGAILIDVGINKTQSGKIVGDFDFESFSDKNVLITPVPGGVGPMTIANLMENVLKLS